MLIGAHVVAGVFAWGIDGGFGAAIFFTGRDSDMATAFVGSVIIDAVTITSLRSVRRQMSYETWYFVHLLAYAGFAISFSRDRVGELFADEHDRHERSNCRARGGLNCAEPILDCNRI